MPIYSIDGPGGKTYEIEGPPGATREQVIAAIQRRMGPMPSATPQEEKPKSRGSWMQDTGLAVAGGALGSIKGLTDVFGAGNAASQGLASLAKSANEYLSPARQEELKKQQARSKAAEETGSTWEEIKAAGQNYMESPLQATAQAAGSIAPYLATSVAGAAAKLLPLTRHVINIAMGTAQGAGMVKGGIYESVHDEYKKRGATDEMARQQAELAQEYTSKNADQILLGGGIGGVATGTGVEKLLSGAAKNAVGGTARRIATGMAAELPAEAAQGGQERLAQNVALQREGADAPTWRGVAGAATEDGLAAGVLGGGVGAFRGDSRAAGARREEEDKRRAQFEQERAAEAKQEEERQTLPYALSVAEKVKGYEQKINELRAVSQAKSEPGNLEQEMAKRAARKQYTELTTSEEYRETEREFNRVKPLIVQARQQESARQEQVRKEYGGTVTDNQDTAARQQATEIAAARGQEAQRAPVEDPAQGELLALPEQQDRDSPEIPTSGSILDPEDNTKAQRRTDITGTLAALDRQYGEMERRIRSMDDGKSAPDNWYDRAKMLIEARQGLVQELNELGPVPEQRTADVIKDELEAARDVANNTRKAHDQALKYRNVDDAKRLKKEIPLHDQRVEALHQEMLGVTGQQDLDLKPTKQPHTDTKEDWANNPVHDSLFAQADKRRQEADALRRIKERPTPTVRETPGAIVSMQQGKNRKFEDQGEMFSEAPTQGIVRGERETSETALRTQLQLAHIAGDKEGKREIIDQIRELREANTRPTPLTSDPRDLAFAKFVETIDRFNKGRGAPEQLQAARRGVVDGLIAEIEQRTGKPVDDTTRNTIASQATKQLDELQNRFGDSRGTILKGSGKKGEPLLIPTQRPDGSFTNMEVPDYLKYEVGGKGRKEPIPDNTAMGAAFKAAGFDPGEKLVNNESQEGTPPSTPEIRGGYENRDLNPPERRQFERPWEAVKSIQQSLDTLRDTEINKGSKPATVFTRTQGKAPTVDSVRQQLGELRTQRNGREPATLLIDQIEENADKLDPKVTSDYLHGLRTGRVDEAAQLDIKNRLAELEEGNRSEIEQPKQQQRTLYNPNPDKGETRTAQQLELDPDDRAKATAFETREEFQKWLASDALHWLRSSVGPVRPTISRMLADIDPLMKELEGYTRMMQSLRAQEDAALTKGEDLMRIREREQALRRRFEEALFKEGRADLMIRVNKARDAHAAALETIKQVKERIEANKGVAGIVEHVDKKGRRSTTDLLDSAVSAYGEAFQRFKRFLDADGGRAGTDTPIWNAGGTAQDSLARPTTSPATGWVAFAKGKEEYYDVLERLQDELIVAQRNVQQYVNDAAVTRFLAHDLELQLQLKLETKRLGAANMRIVTTTRAWQAAKDEQDSDPEVKSARAESDARLELVEETKGEVEERLGDILETTEALMRAGEITKGRVQQEERFAERRAEDRNRNAKPEAAPKVPTQNVAPPTQVKPQPQAKPYDPDTGSGVVDFKARRERAEKANEAPTRTAALKQIIAGSMDVADVDADTERSLRDLVGLLGGEDRAVEVRKLQAKEKELAAALARLEKIKTAYDVLLAKDLSTELRLTHTESINSYIAEIDTTRAELAMVREAQKFTPEQRLGAIELLGQIEGKVDAKLAVPPKAPMIVRDERIDTKLEIAELRQQLPSATPAERIQIVDKIRELHKTAQKQLKEVNASDDKIRAKLGYKTKPKNAFDYEPDESQQKIIESGKLPPRREGPVQQKAVTAGNIRTGDKTTEIERKLNPRNPITQGGKTVAENRDRRKTKAVEDMEIDDLDTTLTAEQEKIVELALQQGTGPAVETAKPDDKTPANAGQLLGIIAEKSKSATNRKLAAKLSEMLSDTRVEYVEDLKDEKGSPVFGAAAVDGSAIYLDKKSGNGETTILHEAVHAALEHMLRKPNTKLTPEQREAKKQLQALYDSYKAMGNAPNANAKASFSEFVAEAMSDPVLQTFLANKPWTVENAWAAFKQAVLQFLGFEPKSMHMFNTARIAVDVLMAKPVRPTKADNEPIKLLYKPVASSTEDVSINKLVARNKPWYRNALENFGLAGEVQSVDRHAAMQAAFNKSKHKEGVKDADLKATQTMFYLRMFDQRFHLTAQSAQHGGMNLTKYTRADGREEYIPEAKGGANLRRMAEYLKDAVPHLGNVDRATDWFTAYMAAIRAANHGYHTLNIDPDKEGGVSEAELKAIKAKVDANPALKKVFEDVRTEYNKYNKDLLHFLVQSGAMSKEKAAALLKNDDYIPFYRERGGVVTLQIGSEAPFHIGDLQRQPYLHELVGDNRPIFNVMLAAMQNTNLLMNMALNNLATKASVYTLRDMGMATVLKGTPAGTDIVQYYDNGRLMAARIETGDDVPADLVVKGMAGIPVQSTGFMKMLGMPATLLRRTVVSTPIYAFRQLFRDSFSAVIGTGADMGSLVSSLDSIKTLERRGIVGGQVYEGDAKDTERHMKRIIGGGNAASEVVMQAQKLSAYADALTRRAQYNSYRKQGLSEMEATMQALEAMNFTKRGASPTIHQINALVPFFNSQVQGLNVLYKAAMGKSGFNDKLKTREKLITRGLMLAGMSLAYAAAMEDDEAYKNAPPDVKYGHWFVRLPGVEQAVKLPIPFEIGYIFKSVPEALYNTMTKEHGGEEAKKAFSQILINTIPGGSSMVTLPVGDNLKLPTPLILPAAFKPVLESAFNFSFYTGRDLVGPSEAKKEPGDQYRDGTSELAKALGAQFNVSPIKLENLVRGYTSSLGLLALHIGSAPLPGSEVEKPTRRMTDIPMLGTMFQANDANGIIDATYKQMEKYSRVKKSIDSLIEKGEHAEAKRRIEEQAEEYAKSQLADHYTKNMQEFNKYQKAITASGLTPAEKRERLNEIQQAKIALAAQVREVDRTTRQAARP